MIGRGKAADVKGPALQEKAPVDPDYDSRWATFANGGGTRINAPGAWLPSWNQRSDQARTAYRAANQGANPASIEDMVPYFSPPLDPALATRLIRSAHEDP